MSAASVWWAELLPSDPASDPAAGGTVSLLPLSDGREPRVVEGGNERRPAAGEPSRLSRDTLRAFDGRSRDSLVEQVLSLQGELKKVKDELKKSKAQVRGRTGGRGLRRGAV